jgi:hypothetical protein
MKQFLLVLFSLLIVSSIAFPQSQSRSLNFKNRSLQLDENVVSFDWKQFSAEHLPVKGKRFAIMQFKQTPDEHTRKELSNAGIELLNYVPNNAYTVAVAKEINRAVLQASGIQNVSDFPAKAKLDNRLLTHPFPAYAIKKAGTVDVLVNVSRGISIHEAITDLTSRKFEVVDTKLTEWKLITLRISQSQIDVLASVPYLEFIQPLPPADKKLNDEVRSNSRANVLNAPIASGGENLAGKGVVIGVGDDADITSHVDLKDRVINRAAFFYENHGTQTSGTAAGAGISEALYQGVAPMATIVSQVFGGIFKYAASYVADYGMVVTNNSYGSISGDCEYAGVYDLYSKVLDDQAFALPDLLHVFAAGNDGTLSCPGYTAGYHTVLGGYQSAKNVLTVGWGEKNATASNSGSHGPTADGRIKPEITTTGSEVRSTGANNTYVTDWGSSLASPAVAGGAALLVEKYRQLNTGANPPAALLKALLMNGANDIDNPGPDFKSGFGWMNLNRSLAMLKANHYSRQVISTGTTSEILLNVPAGMGQLKVMIYWHDPAASVFSAATLVNDIDLEVKNPAATLFLPWILDTAHDNITALATRGADHLNNVEQVTIDNPAAGVYNVLIKGTAINVNPTQEYFLVYDFLPATIDLTFPSAGEPLVPGETITVNWDAWDNSTNPFTLQYSINNGTTWIDIPTSIPSSGKQYNWLVPAVTTGQAKMRLMRTGTALVDESMPFVIAPQAALSLAAIQCEGYITLNWTAVPDASDYEVMMKQGPQMQPVASTTSTSYTFKGLNKDSVYWITVRPKINGLAGRRSDAARVQPNTGNCSGAISNNDLKLDSITTPRAGRKQTSTEITGNNLSVRIKNLDDAPVTNFEVKYSINGGAYITQAVAGTIPALGVYTHTFSGVNFSSAGTYNITAVVKNSTADPVTNNDTLTSMIKQLANDPIALPYVENFDSAPASEVLQSQTGLNGLDHWDFTSTTPYGRVRTFVNTGIAHSGNRAITLDVDRFVQAGNTNYLTGTFNVSSNALTHEVRLDFWFKHHGQNPNANNRVWIRGSDVDTWIEAYDLDANQTMFAGVWQKSASIEVSDLLLANGQNFTSGFQVRFGQHSIIGMGDDQHNGGCTIDDFRLYIAANDVAVIKIESPANNACGLGATVPLKVQVKNLSKATVNNVPITARVDGGTIVTENIASIAANATVTYIFTQGLNLSSIGEHTIDVWTDLASDTYKENDSLLNYTVKNQPVISAFPYLENFENGQGNWYAEGRNSTWQFGTPSSIKINKAASGSKAWKTSLQGSYNDDELSYLYSPCFNIAGLTTPWLSLSVAMDLEQCSDDPCDKAWIEYSTDGISWNKLGTYGQGLNWYNRQGNNVWDSAGFKRWHSAGVPLPVGLSNLRLRVVMNSDESLIKEGIAIDDIHIYDRTLPIYTGPSVTTPVTQTVAGNNWSNFTQGGKVIASLNPNGTNLGSTGVQVFVHTGGFNAVRNINGQYYHDRNIAIKPANLSNTDSTTVRFYFTDAETDTLVRASGCSVCSKPVDAYQLGITKFDDADDSKENGDLTDNVNSAYTFINAAKVAKVPYDMGYYAEFKVKDFSEFWLNNGGSTGNIPLPLLLTSFNVVKQNKDVLVQWSTTNEVNIDKYEVEVARSNDEYRRQQFRLLNTVTATNNLQNTYRITDVELNKNGARYYRLKIIDKNGQVRYSEIKVVVFGSTNEWTVYPNPVQHVLQVVTQAEAGTKVEISLMNTLGQVMLARSIVASGFTDKTPVELNKERLAPGLYIVKVTSGNEVKQFKIVKQ